MQGEVKRPVIETFWVRKVHKEGFFLHIIFYLFVNILYTLCMITSDEKCDGVMYIHLCGHSINRLIFLVEIGYFTCSPMEAFSKHG